MKSPEIFVWLDRAAFIILVVALLCAGVDVRSNASFILMLLLLIMLCDMGVFKDPYVYSIVHSVWHILGWYFLVLAAKQVERKK